MSNTCTSTTLHKLDLSSDFTEKGENLALIFLYLLPFEVKNACLLMVFRTYNYMFLMFSSKENRRKMATFCAKTNLWKQDNQDNNGFINVLERHWDENFVQTYFNMISIILSLCFKILYKILILRARNAYHRL